MSVLLKADVRFAVPERPVADNSHLPKCMIAQFAASLLARPTTTENVTVDEYLLTLVSLVAVTGTGTSAR